MEERRVVGLDLGIASAHTAVVLRADGTEVCRRRCSPTVESFSELERAALHGAPEGTHLEIVVEPTGPAWLPRSEERRVGKECRSRWSPYH